MTSAPSKSQKQVPMDRNLCRMKRPLFELMVKNVELGAFKIAKTTAHGSEPLLNETTSFWNEKPKNNLENVNKVVCLGAKKLDQTYLFPFNFKIIQGFILKQVLGLKNCTWTSSHCIKVFFFSENQCCVWVLQIHIRSWQTETLDCYEIQTEKICLIKYFCSQSHISVSVLSTFSSMFPRTLHFCVWDRSRKQVLVVFCRTFGCVLVSMKKK